MCKLCQYVPTFTHYGLGFFDVIRHLELEAGGVPPADAQLAEDDEDDHGPEASEAAIQDVVPLPVPGLLHLLAHTLLLQGAEVQPCGAGDCQGCSCWC